MKINPYKTTLQKTNEWVYNFLLDTSNFEKILPTNLTFFDSHDKNFTFQTSHLPTKISLQLKENQPFSLLSYTSAGSIVFDLIIDITNHDMGCEVGFSFEGDINPMMKMLIEKPLKNLLEQMRDNMLTAAQG